MLGAMSGIVVHTTLVALGLSALIVASPEAFLVLKAAGAAYLVWLAWQALARGSAFSPDTARRAPRSLQRNWATGLGINLLNPKIILFFMTFLPQFVDAHDPGATGKLFFLGAQFVVLSIPLGIAMVLAAGWLAAAFKRTKWIEKALNWSFAAIFTAFAATILTAQARH